MFDKMKANDPPSGGSGGFGSGGFGSGGFGGGGFGGGGFGGFGGGGFGSGGFGGGGFGGGGFGGGGLFAALPPKPKVINPHLLKARKNLDLPTHYLHLLNSDKRDKPLSGTTTKMLLSKHAKRKPFSKINLSFKKSRFFNKIVASQTKRFTYYGDPSFRLNDDDLDYPPTKSDKKLVRTLCCSFNHLEHLDVHEMNMQSKSSLVSLSKLNHLQSLNIQLQVGNFMGNPRLFQNLKELKHINLTISESPHKKMADFAPLTRFFQGLARLPSLESYCVNIREVSIYEEHTEAFIGAILENLTLFKQKKFSVKINCSESIRAKIISFTSFLERIDACVYNYMVTVGNEQDNFKADASKKLLLVWKDFKENDSAEPLLSACTSLENLFIEQHNLSVSPKNLNLPQTLKALTIWSETPAMVRNYLPDFKTWEEIFSKLPNLENLSLILSKPVPTFIEWAQKVPQLECLKNLKQLHLHVEEDSFPPVKYDNFVREWPQSMKNLNKLEVLDLKLTTLLLDSLDFLTETMASLPQLKKIKIHLALHQAQQMEKLKFSIPPKNLPLLEDIWLGVSEYLSKSCAHKLLQDFGNCENLQSLVVSCLAFDEEVAISTLKKLSHLRKLQIEANTGNTIRMNLKREFIKHKESSILKGL